MLLPGGVRRGAVSCSGPLLLCGGFLPYKIHSGRNTSCSNYLLQSRRQHRSHRGRIFAHALLRQSWASLLQCRSSRANSSLARAKAALRKGGTPQKSGGRPEAVKTPATDSATSSHPVLTPIITELKNEHARHEKLKADYYKAVSKDSNTLWLTLQERREVRDVQWIPRPGGSRNPQRYGISRQNLYFRHVTGAISDPNVRERIVSWEQDTCKDLAPRFREMMLSRARVAHLQGFKSFFEYRSQFKMMNSTSVDLFLKDLKSKIDPYANAFMESAIEQKMNALGYDFTIKKLRERLHGGMTIRDYQNYHPEAQINWGDYSCTYFMSFDSPF
jgi:Peptidase family M3